MMLCTRDSPWPVPRLDLLPASLDESWYPPLRRVLEQFHQQQQALFGDSLASWLQRHDAEPKA